MALAERRPFGIYRWLANAPRWFYRLGLGWLFGQRVMQLTHRGRKSGLVVSGWEGKTDWFRNIQHEPALEVRIFQALHKSRPCYTTYSRTGGCSSGCEGEVY